MGCLILLLVVVGFFTFPFGLIFWALAAMIYIMQGNRQQQNRGVQEMGLLREQQFQLTATPEQKLERDKLREEQRQKDNRNTLIKVGAVAAVILFFVIVGNISHSSTSSNQQASTQEASSTPSPTSVEGTPSTTPAWKPVNGQTVNMTPMPEPTVKRAEPVAQSTPKASASSGSDYIPDPTNEQATEAFNELQDQKHRPHTKSVIYDAQTDSYIWIGPTHGRKMSMKREAFYLEIWNPYYKRYHPEHE